MKSMFDLTGKKALVVGGAGDLGRHMLEALAEAGAEAAVLGRGERTRNIADILREKNYPVTPIFADLSDRVELEAAFLKAMEALGGRIDILVNAAGIQKRHPSEEFPIDDWDVVLEINLTATFLCCQMAAGYMLRQGSGKIINVASMLSYFGGITVPAYAASKGGIAQLTKALANEWASKGLNVNAIAPGYMDTKMNTALVNDPVRSKEILGRIPQRRWGLGEDMKGVTVFLASAASDYVNGAIIAVDGGYLGR